MKRQRTTEVKLTPDQAEVLDMEIVDVIRAWQHSSDNVDLRVLARSCYLQGLVDGSKPEVVTALNALKEAGMCFETVRITSL